MIAGIYRSISVAALLILVLALCNCGSSFNWEGTWVGNRNLPPVEDENPGITRTLGEVKVIIDSSGFKLAEMGVPHTGTIRQADGKAYLKIETRFGNPISKEPQEIQDQMKEIELTPRSDGKIDFYDPGGTFKEPVILERQTVKP